MVICQKSQRCRLADSSLANDEQGALFCDGLRQGNDRGLLTRCGGIQVDGDRHDFADRQVSRMSRQLRKVGKLGRQRLQVAPKVGVALPVGDRNADLQPEFLGCVKGCACFAELLTQSCDLCAIVRTVHEPAITLVAEKDQAGNPETHCLTKFAFGNRLTFGIAFRGDVPVAPREDPDVKVALRDIGQAKIERPFVRGEVLLHRTRRVPQSIERMDRDLTMLAEILERR